MRRLLPFQSLVPVLLVAASSFVRPQPVAADPWQPLDVGRRWEYRSVGGAHQVETIIGTLVLRGRSVAAKYYAEGSDAGLENYWMNGADGTVFLCGFSSPSAGLALAYEPPIAYLPGPPALGVSRTTNVTAYNIGDGTVNSSFAITCAVLQEADLSLPAGMFHALGTGQVAPVRPAIVTARGTYSLDGRSLGGPSAGLGAAASDWYSDGVGDVQYQSTDLYQLIGFGLPTPATRSSWGAVKRLFH